MRGLIDRITNRDKVEELEASVDGLDFVVEKLTADLEKRDIQIQEQNDALKEFEETAETLTGTIRVLKMRFDTIFPATKVEREVDERTIKPE